MKLQYLSFCVLIVGILARQAGAEASPGAGSAFDPARHMRVSEVRESVEDFARVRVKWLETVRSSAGSRK
jgi:hypothetical protein